MTTQPTIDPTKPLTPELLEMIDLGEGAHDSRERGVCAMEAVAWLAGREHTDHPPCVSPLIGDVIRSWNDDLRSDEERNRLLRPLLPDLIGTATGDEEHEEIRSWMALDWLVRAYTPAWLALTEGLRPHAEALRSLPEVTAATAPEALPALRAAKGGAAAAWDAAGDAARDALEPTVRELHESAQDLIRRMAAVGRDEAISVERRERP